MLLQRVFSNDLFFLPVPSFADQKTVIRKQQHRYGPVAFIGQQFNALGRFEFFQLQQESADDRVDIDQGHTGRLLMTCNEPGADNTRMRFYPGNHIGGYGGFNINDIIAYCAIALIDVACYVYVVRADNI